jgi:tetratricopeptide (TPR) repeat protein
MVMLLLHVSTVDAVGGCEALIRKDQKSSARRVYLTGGKAWDLFERYLDEAKKQGVDVSLWDTRVIVSNGRERTEYALERLERLTGQGGRERWSGRLRSVTAEIDEAVYQDAERQQWDIVCSRSKEDVGKGTTVSEQQPVDIPLAAKQNLEAGMQYASRRDWNNAILEFTAAIQKHPTFAAAYGNRGAAYTAQKKFNLALDDIKKGIGLNPKDPFLYYNLTCVYSLQNQLDRAVVALDAALENGFQNYDALRKDPELLNLRKSPEWRKTLEKHKIFLGRES